MWEADAQPDHSGPQPPDGIHQSRSGFSGTVESLRWPALTAKSLSRGKIHDWNRHGRVASSVSQHRPVDAATTPSRSTRLTYSATTNWTRYGS
jgi:hypothetical protein